MPVLKERVKKIECESLGRVEVMEVSVELLVVARFDVLPYFGAIGFKDIQPKEFLRKDVPVAYFLALVHEDTRLPDAETQCLVGRKMPIEGFRVCRHS